MPGGCRSRMKDSSDNLKFQCQYTQSSETNSKSTHHDGNQLWALISASCSIFISLVQTGKVVWVLHNDCVPNLDQHQMPWVGTGRGRSGVSNGALANKYRSRERIYHHPTPLTESRRSKCLKWSSMRVFLSDQCDPIAWIRIHLKLDQSLLASLAGKYLHLSHPLTYPPSEAHTYSQKKENQVSGWAAIVFILSKTESKMHLHSEDKAGKSE